MDTPKPPSGQDIWQAIKGELTSNLYPLPFSTLAPTLYHVYLNPDDYETIEGIVPRLVAEIASALTKEVERINHDTVRRGGRLWGLLRQGESATPVEVPATWDINIQPDHNGELARGSLGIESKLMMPPPVQYGGTPTTRIVKTVLVEGRRSSTVSEVQAQTNSESTSQIEPGAPAAPFPRGAASPLATLRYEDEEQQHVFVMRKESIKIGRGGAGSGAWVDVQVMTSARVSREHCWIRSDASGRFFIQDVSTWGTAVNDAPIPAPERSADGAVVKPGAALELPAEARIALADALVIHFRVERPS
jgi:hypothetical protein